MKKVILSAVMMIVFIAIICGCAGSTADTGGQSDADAYKSDADAYYERLVSCKEQIESKVDFKPQVAIVLGSGLGEYADEFDVVAKIPYTEIEGWPQATVQGHAGNLVFARYKELNVVIMQGRVHYYEGYSMDEVVLPIRVLHLLGADTCILTNAVGAINADYRVGDFVAVKDQISSFVPSPLIGENVDELGPRFVGMTDTYDKAMRKTVRAVGKKKNIPVHSGIYLQVTGPQFETPTEIKMYRKLGADTVAMSMAVEAIAAKQMDMRVCGINCVSNMAAGMEEEGFSHDSINETMEKSFKNFRKLMNGLLDTL